MFFVVCLLVACTSTFELSPGPGYGFNVWGHEDDFPFEWDVVTNQEKTLTFATWFRLKQSGSNRIEFEPLAVFYFVLMS